MNLADPEERAVACAEFVLGTLDQGDRRQLFAAMEQNESLHREVGFWQDRLLGLYKDLAPVEPSANVWRWIATALDQEQLSTSVTATALPSATTLPGAPGSRDETTMLFWKRLGFWRGMTGLAVSFSLLLSLLFMMRPAGPPEATYIAVLQTDDKHAAWIVKVEETGPVRIVPLSDRGSIPEGKSWELWTKGKDAAAPTSLGLIGPGPAEIPRKALPYLSEDQLFEVSQEPEGGSPTGRPTGPILSVGATQRI